MLDTGWLCQWRDDITEAVAAALATFQEQMGYSPDENQIGPTIPAVRLAALKEWLPLFPPDLVMFCRVVGEVSLPDIGNGWFVLSPLCPARIGPPYNVDIVQFASDGGGTAYAVPVGEPRPVLRLREVGEIAAGTYDGDGVHASTPDLRALLTGLRDAIRLFARTGGIADL